MVTITSGPKRTVLRGQRHRMYEIVKNNINSSWFWNMVANPMRGSNYAVRNNAGKLVGFAVMGKNVPREGGAAYIYLIGTKPGQGFGTQLMNRIVANARARRLKYVLLEPITERVRTFYRRFGFNNITPDLMVLNLNRRTPSSQTPARASASRSARTPSAARARQTPPR
jgi:ribosomal protein S18 acetylase RimI-like enzyme